VALALEPAQQRDLKDGSRAIPQQLSCTLDPLLNHVTMWRYPHTLPKEGGKVVGTHARGPGQSGKAQVLIQIQMSCDVVQDLAKSVCPQSARTGRVPSGVAL